MESIRPSPNLPDQAKRLVGRFPALWDTASHVGSEGGSDIHAASRGYVDSTPFAGGGG